MGAWCGDASMDGLATSAATSDDDQAHGLPQDSGPRAPKSGSSPPVDMHGWRTEAADTAPERAEWRSQRLAPCGSLSPESECDSLTVSEASEVEDPAAKEVAAQFCTLPPLLPGLPSALAPSACELDGEWELCNRSPSGAEGFDSVAISESQLRDASGARHFLVYSRKGPTLHGWMLKRHGAALVWKGSSGVRVYLRAGPM